MLVKERFSGEEGRRLLVDALLRSSLANGDVSVAQGLAAAGTLVEYPVGSRLIEQGADENDLVLILLGEVSVLVNGREVARRTAGQHVGEMALVDATARRSATVEARDATVALRVLERDFDGLAKTRPYLWRHVAIELAQRLRQRSVLVRARNDMPKLFIGSSKESLPVAQAIQTGLSHDQIIVRLWTDGVFGASRHAIDDLLSQVDAADFAILVVAPDDKVVSREVESTVPRDNVTFELGLFMGGLGRMRCLVVEPRGIAIKLPTDLLGLTPLDYDPAKMVDLAACMAPVCTLIRQRVLEMGPR
jgi:predicted nucleotide-binding protein